MKSAYAVVSCAILVFVSTTSHAQIVVTEDTDYVTHAVYRDGCDLLDIYVPEGAENVPVLVYFHGGELLYGEKSWGEGIGTRVAEYGIGLVSANYRLSPDHAHPAHAADAAAAVAWVAKNISSYGGDPNNVYVVGHSAGGYLAALLAVDPSYLESVAVDRSVIQGAILISPFLYIEETAPVRIKSGPRYKSIWGEDTEGWLAASVTPHIGPDRNDILVIYADGDEDCRKDQNERFASAMTAAGSVNVRAVLVPNRTHGSLVTSILDEDDRLGIWFQSSSARRNRPRFLIGRVCTPVNPSPATVVSIAI